MCDGVVFNWLDLPRDLIEQHDVADRVVSPNDSERHIVFMRKHTQPLLPVWHEGQLLIVQWGAKTSGLPTNGICKLESLEQGRWSHLRPKKVTVDASLIKDKGRWIDIREGIEAIIFRDTQRQWHGYVITEPASYYYQIMTKHNRMPVFIGKDF